MKNEEVMLRLGCDVHSWMTAYVGVVTNPYFAVSDASGSFDIERFLQEPTRSMRGRALRSVEEDCQGDCRRHGDG